jgi:protein TonB
LKATATPQPKVKNNYHKKAFLRNVRSKIIANKKYPKIAKRRHIEGSVKVRFDITKRGHVSNIRFINGKRVFQKSIRKTLERTFPMGIPANVKGELPIMNVSVVLHFNIR